MSLIFQAAMAARRYCGATCFRLLVVATLALGWTGTSSAQSMKKEEHVVPSLHSFEKLQVTHLHHSLQHGDHKDLGHQREIKLRVFNRDFHLHLAVHRSLFHPKFVAYEVDALNRKTARHVNQAAFYHGVVLGEDASRVVAHVNEQNVLTASIHVPGSTYSIEPSSRHIKVPHDFHMIAYRDTDVKGKPEAKACGLTPEDEGKEDLVSHFHDVLASPSNWWRFGTTQPNSSQGTHARHNRLRRQVTEGLACPVTLVADSFYAQGIGNGDFQTAASSMIQQLNYADTIVFQRSVFIARDGSSIQGTYGMQLRDVIVHQQANANGSVPYNTGQPMTVRNLLTAMSRGNWNTRGTTGSNPMPGVCLAHLFTHQGFAGNVLGLAYVASPDLSSVGGVCNVAFQGNRWLNVGLTTTQNCPTGDISNCQTLIQREADLVTAHELGHNWGSQHDSLSTCISDGNGRYLMNQYALPGTESNNNAFSTCSRQSIGAVIIGKQDVCFVRRVGSFCGNGLPEDTEQCDAGFGNSQDPCCTQTCRLRNPGTFQCSDANFACCVNCTFAPATKVCQQASSDRDLSCRDTSLCSGTNTTCVARFKTTGPCGSFGTCSPPSVSDGARCRGYCEANLTSISCVCPAIADQCVVCCKASAGAPCEVASNRALQIQDGAGCGQGYCLNGVCQEAVLDSTEKLFGFLSDFSADTIARWFRNNIVAAVLVCTFIAWIIGGCIVRYVDRTRMATFNKEFDEYKEKMEQYIGSQSITPKQLRKRNSQRRASAQPRPDSRGGIELAPLMEEAMLHQ